MHGHMGHSKIPYTYLLLPKAGDTYLLQLVSPTTSWYIRSVISEVVDRKCWESTSWLQADIYRLIEVTLLTIRHALGHIWLTTYFWPPMQRRSVMKWLQATSVLTTEHHLTCCRAIQGLHLSQPTARPSESQLCAVNRNLLTASHAEDLTHFAACCAASCPDCPGLRACSAVSQTTTVASDLYVEPACTQTELWACKGKPRSWISTKIARWTLLAM